MEECDAVIDRTLRDAHRASGDDGTAGVECFHYELETGTALRTHAIVRRDEHIVEKQRTRRDAARTHFFLLSPNGKSLGPSLPAKQVDAVPTAAIGNLPRTHSAPRPISIAA